MNEQDDTKLWQILGHASQPAPGDDFARKVMMRIEREECAPAVPVESIHHFKRLVFLAAWPPTFPRTFQKAQTRSGTLSGGKNHAVV